MDCPYEKNITIIKNETKVSTNATIVIIEENNKTTIIANITVIESNKTEIEVNKTVDVNQTMEQNTNKTANQKNQPSVNSTIIKEPFKETSKCLNNTNFTICFNITKSNCDTCAPECYLNCQMHFTSEIEQKYCLLNVCKCDIFKETVKNNQINAPQTIQNIPEIQTNQTITNLTNTTVVEEKQANGIIYIIKIFLYQ